MMLSDDRPKSRRSTRRPSSGLAARSTALPTQQERSSPVFVDATADLHHIAQQHPQGLVEDRPLRMRDLNRSDAGKHLAPATSRNAAGMVKQTVSTKKSLRKQQPDAGEISPNSSLNINEDTKETVDEVKPKFDVHAVADALLRELGFRARMQALEASLAAAYQKDLEQAAQRCPRHKSHIAAASSHVNCVEGEAFDDASHSVSTSTLTSSATNADNINAEAVDVLDVSCPTYSSEKIPSSSHSQPLTSEELDSLLLLEQDVATLERFQARQQNSGSAPSCSDDIPLPSKSKHAYPFPSAAEHAIDDEGLFAWIANFSFLEAAPNDRRPTTTTTTRHFTSN